MRERKERRISGRVRCKLGVWGKPRSLGGKKQVFMGRKEGYMRRWGVKKELGVKHRQEVLSERKAG